MVDAYNQAHRGASGDQDAKISVANSALCEFCGLDASCGGTSAARCRGSGCLDRATEATFANMYLGQSGAQAARRIRESALEQVRRAVR